MKATNATVRTTDTLLEKPARFASSLRCSCAHLRAVRSFDSELARLEWRRDDRRRDGVRYQVRQKIDPSTGDHPQRPEMIPLRVKEARWGAQKGQSSVRPSHAACPTSASLRMSAPPPPPIKRRGPTTQTVDSHGGHARIRHRATTEAGVASPVM
jgi:hypothetical protein